MAEDVVSLTPEQEVELAELELKHAKLKAKLERLRSEVHAARDAGGIPQAMARRWRAAQHEMREHRRGHRERQIELGLRGEGVSVVTTKGGDE